MSEENQHMNSTSKVENPIKKMFKSMKPKEGESTDPIAGVLGSEKAANFAERVAKGGTNLAGQVVREVKDRIDNKTVLLTSDHSCTSCGSIWMQGDKIIELRGVPICPQCGGVLKRVTL